MVILNSAAIFVGEDTEGVMVLVRVIPEHPRLQNGFFFHLEVTCTSLKHIFYFKSNKYLLY